MLAIQIVALTGPDGVRLREVPNPVRGDDVLVQVHAVGVRYADLLRSQGLYQERSEPPYVAFGEMSGVVVDAPQGSRFKHGDRVAGSAPNAGAEFAVAPAALLYAIPPRMTFEQGAAIALNYETAVYGLEVRARLKSGETVLVHGAGGGTGTAAIQIATALGGTVIAVVSSDQKEAIARQAGAAHVLRSDNQWRAQALALTDGRGVDAVWDPVGGERTLDTLRTLAPLGRWVVIGFVGGPIPSVALNRILLKNVDVIGAFYGGYVAGNSAGAVWLHERVAALILGGSVRPIIGSSFALDDAANALRLLERREAVGKVVIRIR